MLLFPRNTDGVTFHCNSSIPSIVVRISSIPTPSPFNPLTISSESRETKGRRSSEGLVHCEARMSALFVTDFEPGITTREITLRDPRNGAGQ